MLEAITTRLVCKRSEEVRQTASGIILQRDNSEEIYAEVLSAGPDVKTIVVGDRLIVDWRTVAQTKHEGDSYYIVDVTNVLAIVR